MFVEIKELFFKYAPWLILLPTLVAIINKKKHSVELKPILYYLILSVLTQTISFIFWKQSINNLPILHIYTLLEFLILLWFYSILLKDFFSNFIFLIFGIFFTLFAIIDSLLLENIFTFNTLGRSIEALILIFLSICWFIKIVSTDETSILSAYRGVNYINSGFLIYFSGSIVLFSFSNYINQLAHPLLMNIWTIHTLLAVLLYFIITLGLWKYKTK